MQELGIMTSPIRNRKEALSYNTGYGTKTLKTPLEKENHQQVALPNLKYCNPTEMNTPFYIRALQNSRISNIFHLKQKVF